MWEVNFWWLFGLLKKCIEEYDVNSLLMVLYKWQKWNFFKIETVWNKSKDRWCLQRNECLIIKIFYCVNLIRIYIMFINRIRFRRRINIKKYWMNFLKVSSQYVSQAGIRNSLLWVLHAEQKKAWILVKIMEIKFISNFDKFLMTSHYFLI